MAKRKAGRAMPQAGTDGRKGKSRTVSERTDRENEKRGEKSGSD